ncbi:hypothetical protein [Pseudacidobacterium ailaaui]|jgi:hypothetical protein|uniref:hypothetical protein n=1 Tax=Pseudacidobacterium ailaaui TaxID=1382359 RepID=UPI0005D1DC72|nr:hypothetical protein [Pseudacidobacterium ailaaui]MBX6359491.1 hypothetical protein [Pseudacidobacterium ailaaui]MCL6463531.1 hypothetical protein [Pseudacidobacterium ailaaui]MDI3255461.1 hypothetical protein [Bacillota bacterium]
MKRLASILLGFLLALGVPLHSEGANKRLILKDGSYQVVTDYQIVGDRVRYKSAERGGEWEEVPTNLVDWAATEKWNKEHAPGALAAAEAAQEAAAQNDAAAIDKEAAAERAEEQARMPVVSPGLRLPDESGVWVLDTFHGTPELVRLEQSNGDINKNLGHNVLKAAINPMGGTKQLVQIDGARSKIQVHVSQPELYVSLDSDDETAEAPEDALKIDTHGLSSKKDKNNYSSPTSRYVIVRVQSRRNLRVVAAMNISMVGKISHSENIVDTDAQILPGKHWMKLVPKEPLSFGEYALMEVLSPEEVNLDVWDFGVDPTAPENKNTLGPIQPAK